MLSHNHERESHMPLMTSLMAKRVEILRAIHDWRHIEVKTLRNCGLISFGAFGCSFG